MTTKPYSLDKRAAPTNEEIAWAAGIFEGEGCFSTTGKPGIHGRRHLRATLMMKDEDIVRRFAAVVGVGKVYDRKCRSLTVWHCGKRAEFRHLAEMFRPWLGERRIARLDELIHLSELPVGTVADAWKRRKERGLKLTERDVREIRASTDSGAALSERFGVSESAVSMIRHRRTWAHLK